jgi:hypothetical protein
MQPADAAIQQSLNPGGSSMAGTAINSLPNYDAMYRQDTTPLVNAATPGVVQESFAPVAANEAIGGNFGSAW